MYAYYTEKFSIIFVKKGSLVLLLHLFETGRRIPAFVEQGLWISVGTFVSEREADRRPLVSLKQEFPLWASGDAVRLILRVV